MEIEMADFPNELLQLAFVPGFQDGYPELAALAEQENWGYTNATARFPNPILSNYVNHTYKRLVEENKIVLSPDGQKLCFNTGLVTPNQEEIFAVFSVNRAEGKQPWFLYGW